MLPIRDLNPTCCTPYVTYVLIGLNVLVFTHEVTLLLPGRSGYSCCTAMPTWATTRSTLRLSLRCAQGFGSGQARCRCGLVLCSHLSYNRVKIPGQASGEVP